jgi:hypothetical protein
MHVNSKTRRNTKQYGGKGTIKNPVNTVIVPTIMSHRMMPISTKRGLDAQK